MLCTFSWSADKRFFVCFIGRAEKNVENYQNLAIVVCVGDDVGVAW